MNVLSALGIMALVSAACGAADAAPSAYSDFDVVSVVPRSPNVRPLVMSISTRERRNTPNRYNWTRLAPTAKKG
jgi:hypothetical protein